MADIWSCPDCGTDLREWWCPVCERLWSPQSIADWDDPPDYTETDRAYDRQAIARDYGLREDWL